MPIHPDVRKNSGDTFNAKKFFRWLSAALSIAIASPAIPYDNSKFPPFKVITPDRRYQHISIHPNEEEWLITEVADREYVLLYNLRTHRLQSYETPGNYRYTFATFSPDGEQIAMIRRQRLPGETIADQLEELKTSEITIMNKDGSDFRVLPLPAGIITKLTISPDGKKIAYWLAQTIRKPGSKTFVADFDVREYDLTLKTEKLFAGPFNFASVNGLNYLTNSRLIVGAFAPRMAAGDIWDYVKKFNNSEVYQLDRNQTKNVNPSYGDRYYANHPVTDIKKNIYFIDYPLDTGQALTKISSDGKSTSWRMPDLGQNNIYHLAASQSGNYLVFIYGNSSIRTGKSEFSIGMFRTDQERWLPITPPPVETASPIAVTPSA